MKQISQKTTKMLSATVLALSVTMPLMASADKISTPFSGLAGLDDNGVTPQEWFNKLNGQMQPNTLFQGMANSAETQNGFEPLWSADMDMADAEAEINVSQACRLEDGGYIGVYTCGGETKIREGRIVRMSATGEKMWETVLQANYNTTANKVCQGKDGNFYVLGTTTGNGSMQAYIACIDETGHQTYLTTVQETEDVSAIYPTDVLQAGDETVIVYTATSDYTNTLTARWYDTTGQQTRDLYQAITAGTKYTSRLGNFLMIPTMSNKVFAIDLENGTLALEISQPETSAVYQNGCATEDALYTLYRDSSSMLVLTQYKVENDKLVEKWKCTTSQNSVNFDAWAHPLNEGKVLIYNKKSQGNPGMVIVNPDGNIYKNQTGVYFGTCNGAWPYAATQAADGTIYIFGMYSSGMKFALCVLTTAADLSNPQFQIFDNLDPGHTLYYSQYNQSHFTDGQCVFSGYMRPQDWNKHGFTPIFGTYTIEDNQMRLLYTGIPGNIAKVYPKKFAVDKDYNVYASVESASKYYKLVKYNSKGEQEWVETISTGGGATVEPVVLTNGNICAGCYNEREGLRVVCLTPDGQEVYNILDTSILEDVTSSNGCYAVQGEDNSIIIVNSGYSSKLNRRLPYITKVDVNGQFTSKLITDFDTSSDVCELCKDNDGNIYILGAVENSEKIACPMIIKVDADLQVQKAFMQEIDVRCPLYYGAVDNQGRIFAAGNTQYHGMIFVYDKNFSLLGYDIYASTTNATSVYQSISLTADGNALVSACYKDMYSKNSGLILCFNEKAELQWQYERKDNGTGQFYFYAAAQSDNNIIATGYCASQLGVQVYGLELGENREVLKEYFTPTENPYLSCSCQYADIVNGNAYLASTYGAGIAVLGNITCFGNPRTLDDVELLFSSEDNQIVLHNGSAALSDGSIASWNLYTIAGTKVLSCYDTRLCLNSVQSGIYIVTAGTENGLITKRIIK